MKSLLLLFLLLASPAWAAITERYASVSGSGAFTGADASNEWTLAQAFASAVAGDRVNIKSGSYSQAAVTVPAGTGQAHVVFRGYNATIGDLDATNRASNGTLTTTNFPVITVTGIITPANCFFFQNVSFTGSLSSYLIGNNAADSWGMIGCKVENTASNASASCVQGDNSLQLINCDFSCTQTTRSYLVDTDISTFVFGCRFSSGGTDTDGYLLLETGTVANSTFVGGGAATGLQVVASSGPVNVSNNTFYNLGTAISTPNTVAGSATDYVLINNHITDCAKGIDNLYAGTANVPVILINNRTRDNTTLFTGVDQITFGAITTDTGGAATDYTNAGGGDLTLISAAPGVGAGIPVNRDVGAFQRAGAGGGGSTETSHTFVQ